MDDDFEFPTTSNMEEGLDMDMDVPEDDDLVSPILKVGEEKEIGKNGLKLLAMKLKVRLSHILRFAFSLNI